MPLIYIRAIPVFICLVLFTLTTCGKDSPTRPKPPDPPPPVVPVATRIDITPPSATLNSVGQTIQLNARVLDQNNAPISGAAVTWTSSDNGVATVTVQGLVTAVKNGTARITARSGNISANANVTVLQTAGSIVIESAMTTLTAIGQTVQLTANVLDRNDKPVAGAVVTWTSSDASVATVNEQGLVTAVKSGGTRITARSGSASAGITVTVMQSVASIVIEPEMATLMSIGETVQLTATVLDQNRQPVDDAVVTWQSSDEEVATVSAAGLVTAIGNGMATVTARSGNASQTATLTVTILDTRRDREALAALYHSTDGPNWTNNTNWLSDAPLDSWHGIGTTTLGEVQYLNLGENNLHGIIPPEIGKLQKLTVLALYGNSLTGNIPPEIGQLQNLTDLNLGDNELSGPIPTEIGQLQKLTGLTLAGNQLSGPIPPNIVQLLELKFLWLGGNQLSGPIPTEIGQLQKLTTLWLGANQLTGNIPPEIGQLRNLTDLNLDFNQLSGSIPPLIGQLQHLKFLRLNGNQLTGSIPPEIGQLSMLRFLNMAFNPNLSGPLPVTITSLSNMESLSLHYTQVCIPPTAQFQSWLDGIENIRGDISSCPGPEGPVEPEEPEEPEMPPPVGERLDVRIVYFVPANHTGYPNIDAKIDSLVNIVKLTYAEIFEFHGFGDRTFQHEQNADGTARVYHVKGQYDGEYYSSETFFKVIHTELEQIFDLESNIYWVVLDAIDATVDGYCGQGYGDLPEGGAFLIPGPNDYWLEDRGWSCFNPSVASHEIGHSFGLTHDLLRDEVRVESSYQDDWMITSYCAAEWMSVHPFFTGEPTTGNDNEGEISLRSISDASSETIRLVFDVSDPDMLHQAQLLDRNGETIAYRGLEGESATVVFETDQVSYGDQILLRTIDKRAFVVEGKFIIDRDGPITVRQLQTGRPFKPQY